MIRHIILGATVSMAVVVLFSCQADAKGSFGGGRSGGFSSRPSVTRSVPRVAPQKAPTVAPVQRVAPTPTVTAPARVEPAKKHDNEARNPQVIKERTIVREVPRSPSFFESPLVWLGIGYLIWGGDDAPAPAAPAEVAPAVEPKVEEPTSWW